MANEGVPIYKVNIDGEERKAFDLVALKQFLEEQRLRFSILNMDPDDIDDTASVHKYIASTAMNVLNELEGAVDRSLGLTNTENEEPEQTETQKPTVNEEQNAEQPQPQPQPPKQEKAESAEQPPTQPEVDESKDEITI